MQDLPIQTLIYRQRKMANSLMKDTFSVILKIMQDWKIRTYEIKNSFLDGCGSFVFNSFYPEYAGDHA